MEEFKDRLSWLEHRRGGVGASDCPSIMGDSPYSSILDIYNSKINPAEEKEPNYVMELGNKLEPIARSRYELLKDADFPAANFVHAIKPHLRCSLDGFNIELNKAIEIKYSGKSFTESCPDKYYPQVQYQYAVTNCDFLELVQINNMNEINIIPIQRDDEYITRLLEKVDWFWDCVVNKKLQEIIDAVPVKVKKPRKKKGEVNG
jgi:putative phage-type endonuclease